MGLNLTSAVHWWEEWQMRILVLSSLVIQFILLSFSFVRRLVVPGWIRFIMWLVYLAADAVAIYALATLFNRHKDGDRGGSILEVIWAPVLLMHLGGLEGITAYNIEDNELWSRHLVTAVSQVTVATYVFCKSWPGDSDKRLLQAAILWFIPGILKCFGKAANLKRGSVNSLVNSSSADVKGIARSQNEGSGLYSLEKYVEQAMAFVGEQKGGGEGMARQGERASVVEEGHHPPSQKGNDINSIQVRRELLKREMILHGEAYKLCVDLSSPYYRRLRIFKYFWVLSQEEVYGSVRQGLASAFLLLYTGLKTTIFSGMKGRGN